MRDSRSLIDEVEYFDPPTEDQRERARRIIAACAEGETREQQVADADALMRMLGVHPSQDEEFATALTPNSPVPHAR